MFRGAAWMIPPARLCHQSRTSGSSLPPRFPTIRSSSPYRRLADVFHDLLSEQSLDALLVRIADALDELVPYEALHVYEADEAQRELDPGRSSGASGRADPERALPVRRGHHRLGGRATASPCSRTRRTSTRACASFPGTPVEPEALIVVPLVARGVAQGHAERLPDRRRRVVHRAGVRAREAVRRRGRARARQRAHPRAARAPGADRLADRPLQPPLLPRAAAARADPRVARATTRVALVMMDIDDFKKVNDVYGHGVGDQVLAELADHAARRRALDRRRLPDRRRGVRRDRPRRRGRRTRVALADAARPSASSEVEFDLAGQRSPSRSASRTAPSTRRTRASSSPARRRR